MLLGNPMIVLFEGKKATASGVAPSSKGTYTSSMFVQDFPQFTDSDSESFVPDTMLDNFINMANDTISPDVWGTSWRYAAGLFVAHMSAMYLKTYSASSDSAAAAVSGADQVGVVKSATMGDTSVSYDASAITAGTEKWGTWNATTYGSQLVTMARQIGIAGSFIV